MKQSKSEGGISSEFEALLDLLWQTPDLVAVFDSTDRLQVANPAYCAAYCCNAAQQPFWQDIM